MRKIVRLIVGCGLLAGLGACGHAMTLSPLDGGEAAQGGSLMRGSPLMVKLDGKVYRGQWRAPGSSDAKAPALTRVASGPVQVGRYYGQRGAGGAGIADFTAKDGSSLVCRFRYERGQEHGSGLCESDQGRTFSLIID